MKLMWEKTEVAKKTLEGFMKKAMLVLSLAGLVIIFTGAAYANTGLLRVTIPFEFYVGNTQLPAGDYIFEMRPISTYSATSSSVVVKMMDGTVAARIATMPGTAAMDNNQLHFSRYGNQYFLAKVESSGLQAGLKATHREKELLAQALAPQGVIVGSK
jgi:hypothetical protein